MKKAIVLLVLGTLLSGAAAFAVSARPGPVRTQGVG
jgi:hypothetical protein